MWEPGAEVLEGRFKILQAVGVTSSTENYLAEQVSLARKVSLRVIRPELGLQPNASERFDREVRRIAAVDHPGVVRVIDSGRHEKTLYLVTEQVDGTLLSSELKQGEPFLPERALEVLTQLAEALAAVHEKGLVHGELNPKMVVLASQRARLLDFGVARLLDAESPEERLTVATRTITAPEYLSPEQLKGRDADGASDVYSLGVLALRLLSGTSQVQPLGGHLADQHALIELVGRCTATDTGMRPSSREAWQKFLKLPRPAEPTLFLEAMQRPPELPAKPVPVPPALPQKPPPPELLKSVPMLTLTPAKPLDALPQALPEPAKPSRWPMLAALLVVVLTVAAIAGFGLMSSPASESRALIEKRQPSQALEILNKALRKKPTPELSALRAAALHLSGQHKEEESTFRSLPADAKEALDPLVLGGVVEDFGTKEDTGLRAALKALPIAELKKVLEGFANEAVSMKQWGALRWLDLESQAGGLKLVPLYSISLESNACPVRKLAAKRLQELDDDTAVDALNRAKEATEKDCGQAEAAAAVQSLKKLR